MENALNDSSIVYEWSIKINKTSNSDQGINIGIASDPFSKPIGNCCDSSYDYSHVFKKLVLALVGFIMGTLQQILISLLPKTLRIKYENSQTQF